MPEFFPCPYLDAAVECTDERHAHVLEGHPELACDYWERVPETLADPDRVLGSNAANDGVLFLRWYGDLDKMVVAVVTTDPGRNWLITGYITGDMPRGETLWERN